MTNIETNVLVISWQSRQFIFLKMSLCSTKLFYSSCVIQLEKDSICLQQIVLLSGFTSHFSALLWLFLNVFFSFLLSQEMRQQFDIRRLSLEEQRNHLQQQLETIREELTTKLNMANQEVYINSGLHFLFRLTFLLQNTSHGS